MSLRDDLDQMTSAYQQRKVDRKQARREIKAVRDNEDAELGRQHALEDIDNLVANIKQAAMNGIQEYEVEVEQAYESYTPAYTQGYYDAVRAYMQDHNVGLYLKSQKAEDNSRLVFHSIFIYWR